MLLAEMRAISQSILDHRPCPWIDTFNFWPVYLEWVLDNVNLRHLLAKSQ